MARMTYHEAAAALGITLESARRTARKKRWPKSEGNDGLARIEVPDELLEERQQDRPEDRPEDGHEDARALIARLEAELAGVREVVTSERTRADAERRRADEILQQLAKVEQDRDARLSQITAERDQWIARATAPWWRRLVG